MRSQERSIKRHDLAVSEVHNCKDYAVSSLCESRDRTEHKQSESTATVGAAISSGIPLIGICDHHAVHRVFS